MAKKKETKFNITTVYSDKPANLERIAELIIEILLKGEEGGTQTNDTPKKYRI